MNRKGKGKRTMNRIVGSRGEKGKRGKGKRRTQRILGSLAGKGKREQRKGKRGKGKGKRVTRDLGFAGEKA
jgi:hypothetical protein